MVSTPAAGAPCDPLLYRPVAIIIIVTWASAGVACPIVLCALCCAMCFLGSDGMAAVLAHMKAASQAHNAIGNVSQRRLR
jgi:hypothetical protein